MLALLLPLGTERRHQSWFKAAILTQPGADEIHLQLDMGAGLIYFEYVIYVRLRNGSISLSGGRLG